MSNPASYLSQQGFDPRGHPDFGQVQVGQVGQAGPGVARTNDQLALFRCAAQMMATGALTDDQAKTLSRLLRQSAA